MDAIQAIFVPRFGIQTRAKAGKDMKSHSLRTPLGPRFGLQKMQKPLLSLAAFAALSALSAASNAEPAACLSSDPSQWPAPSKPYFMIAFDTSGSMGDVVASSNSCMYPNNRLGHGRCAIKNTLLAFAGQVNFGLATYARQFSGCTLPGGACPTGDGLTWTSSCTFSNMLGNAAGVSCTPGCGPEPSPDPTDSTTRAGANIVVPMQRDNYYALPLDPSNTASLLQWVDNDCTGGKELFPSGCTPMNGMLRDMNRYFSSQWVHPSGAPTHVSPLGTLAQGERPCRSVNVIFVTDGQETCDQSDDAADAAADMFTGFTKDGINWKVKTFVIDFGDAGSQADAIAAAGGTGSAKDATDESTLSAALADIISNAISPESCDNGDNNCNGCTDEGFKHYCNTNPTCCAWATPAERQTCLSNYQNSITAADPDGDLTLLPCTTAQQQTDPANWLCYNPKESCDSADNNCQDGADEGVVKCGNPAHCPSPEVCNATDDDCDGLIDEGLSCPCIPKPETCNGCDDDCDGFTDNGIAPIPCGLSNPPNCLGQILCQSPVAVPVGSCLPPGNYFNSCNNAPQVEVCDGIDNDCDGTIDDNIMPTPCDPPGGPYNYGPSSQCKQGQKACGGQCVGAVGPSTEICDGIDNDCDGQVDEGIAGLGLPCGLNQPPCQPGTTACVNGALVCQGGTGPQNEVCDGIDNDCDGIPDDAPLSDGPAAGMTGCWNLAGGCCTFANLNWCPPPGASCNDIGILTSPCTQGVIQCAGGAGWICQGSKLPSAEVCDGIDNDCDSVIDDGNLPMEGLPCGSDEGLCNPGALDCQNGILACIGATGPTQEVCDGLDNDCDGTIDNNIPSQGLCVPQFDQISYPETPTDVLQLKPPCQLGTLECDGMGNFVCTGGLGPTPELCDGIDNDCDGKVDELGIQPNGINGTLDPNPPPAGVKIGDACGLSEGQCAPGQWGCLNGNFECLGGTGPAPYEECDCIDNDCDGSKDEDNEPNEPPICSAGKTCVKSGGSCQCAEKCVGELQVCPTAGQECNSVTDSNDNPLTEQFCVAASPCGNDNCVNTTVTDAANNVLCAPLGTTLANCKEPPICVCKGQAGCQDPCFNVMCAPGLICATHGPNAGTCTSNNCYNIPCAGCDSACFQGQCVPNPCEPNPCPAGQACKPNSGFSGFTCFDSCANVNCMGGQICVGGQCVTPCTPDCPSGQFCDYSLPTPACAPSQCALPTCPDGSCCDPKTGVCGGCSCEGVVCPPMQACSNGQCISVQGGTGGGGGGSASSSSSTSGSGTGGASGSSSSGGTGGYPPPLPTNKGNWGLATGGGGCTCRMGEADSSGQGMWALAALAACAAATGRRRRRSTETDGEVSQ